MVQGMSRLSNWMLAVFSLFASTAQGETARLQLGPFEPTNPRQLTITLGSDDFGDYEALNGSFSSFAQCQTVPNGLWVDVDGEGDCIRYFAHGLRSGPNPRVMVYLSGDVLLRTSKGIRFITPAYGKISPDGLEAEMREWSAGAGIPAIYISRPGIYGSSGDHNNRRQAREIALVDGAVDQLASRFHISDFVIVGHSGGGQIAAALLNRRADVGAAVISSGLVAVKQVTAFWENRRTIPGTELQDESAFYDPIDEVAGIRKHPPPSIYLISDWEDPIVPIETQQAYAARLRAAGLKVVQIYAQAVGRSHHDLSQQAKLAAVMLVRGNPAAEIKQAVQDFNVEVPD